jgi:16S rRNA (cytosine967-C5)-methyltransferase
MDNPRELALESLIKTDTLSVFSNLEINTTLQRASLSETDRGLYTALYLGVLEKKLTLDYIIKKYSSTPLEKIEVTEINLLRLVIYQLYFMDKIPDYSAVDECVSLAPKKTKGFIMQF